MRGSRRFAVIGGVGLLVWYVCVLVFWASQPLSDSVPVGIDYTLKVPAFVSARVQCGTVFDDSARGASPLPVLKSQPSGSPKLAFQREPCGVVQHHARIVFGIDTFVFAALAACLVWVLLRYRRSIKNDRVTSHSELSLSH